MYMWAFHVLLWSYLLSHDFKVLTLHRFSLLLIRLCTFPPLHLRSSKSHQWNRASECSCTSHLVWVSTAAVIIIATFASRPPLQRNPCCTFLLSICDLHVYEFSLSSLYLLMGIKQGWAYFIKASIHAASMFASKGIKWVVRVGFSWFITQLSMLLLLFTDLTSWFLTEPSVKINGAELSCCV